MSVRGLIPGIDSPQNSFILDLVKLGALLRMVVPCVSALFRFLFRRFAVSPFHRFGAALVYRVSRFPFCRFSHDTILKIWFFVSRATLRCAEEIAVVSGAGGSVS